MLSRRPRRPLRRAPPRDPMPDGARRSAPAIAGLRPSTGQRAGPAPLRSRCRNGRHSDAGMTLAAPCARRLAEPGRRPGRRAVARRPAPAARRAARRSCGRSSGRRWQRPHPGVRHCSPARCRPDPAVVGRRAATPARGRRQSCGTAAWLHGLRDDVASARIDVCVPHGHRRLAERPGCGRQVARGSDRRRPPGQLPPRTWVEDTVLDLTDDAPDGRRRDRRRCLLRCQRRLTTAARLGAAAGEGRSRLRWRAAAWQRCWPTSAMACMSALERRYDRDVELPHGLPADARNRQEGAGGRALPRRPVQAMAAAGRAGRPSRAPRRMAVSTTTSGTTEVVAGGRRRSATLRYGWRSVLGRPCDVAVQVGACCSRRLDGRRRRAAARPCDLAMIGALAGRDRIAHASDHRDPGARCAGRAGRARPRGCRRGWPRPRPGCPRRRRSRGTSSRRRRR